MMVIFSRRGRAGRVAFTLTEVMVAVGVIGVLFVSLYLAFSAGFSIVRVTRENLRATQILVQRMETVRLYSWSQLTNAAVFKPSFTEDAMTSLGTVYHGQVQLSEPAGIGTPSYLSDLRVVTIAVRWTNTLGPVVPHYRQMQTQVAKNGLQNYATEN